jgi:hypothetical protein
MSIEKIASSAKNQLDELEARSENFWSGQGVNEVSAILKIVSRAFHSLNHLARESSSADLSSLLSDEQLNNILGLFNELEDNFFPMAHTSAPLGSLKIIDAQKGNKLLSYQQEDIHMLENFLRMLSDSLNQMEKVSTNLKKTNERLRDVLNP